MTRAEAVALFRREAVTAMVSDLEDLIHTEAAELEARGAGATTREGLTAEDCRLVLEVAREFVGYVREWEGR